MWKRTTLPMAAGGGRSKGKPKSQCLSEVWRSGGQNLQVSERGLEWVYSRKGKRWQRGPQKKGLQQEYICQEEAKSRCFPEVAGQWGSKDWRRTQGGNKRQSTTEGDLQPTGSRDASKCQGHSFRSTVCPRLLPVHSWNSLGGTTWLHCWHRTASPQQPC